jgi:hypothetical protein
MKITQLYDRMKSESERISLIESVQNSSIMSWSHINTNWEYVFNEKRAASGSFDFDKLTRVEIRRNIP